MIRENRLTVLKLREIRWLAGKYSCHYAIIGKLTVATLSWSMTRNDPTPWHLTVPRFGTESRTQYKDFEEARAALPAILLSLVELLVEEI